MQHGRQSKSKGVNPWFSLTQKPKIQMNKQQPFYEHCDTQLLVYIQIDTTFTK